MQEPANAEQDAPEDLAGVLRALPDAGLTFGALATRFGTRAHGLALLMLALPDALPLPIPSVALVLGLPMLAISVHLAMFGEGTPLPPWLARRAVPDRLVAVLRSRVAAVLAVAERFSDRRWPVLASRERLVGLTCLLLSVLLMLPIPLFNTPPALCLALLAWGLARKDGAFVLAGLLGTALLMGLLGMAVVGSWQFLAAAAQTAGQFFN